MVIDAWCMMREKRSLTTGKLFPKILSWMIILDKVVPSRIPPEARERERRTVDPWSSSSSKSNYSLVGFRIIFNKERFLTFFSYRFIASTRSNENSRLDFAKSVIAACLEFLKCPSWFIHVMEPKKKKETVQRSKPITVIYKKKPIVPFIMQRFMADERSTNN